MNIPDYLVDKIIMMSRHRYDYLDELEWNIDKELLNVRRGMVDKFWSRNLVRRSVWNSDDKCTDDSGCIWKETYKRDGVSQRLVFQFWDYSRTGCAEMLFEGY